MKTLTTYSDAGSVKVGIAGRFTALIGNGYGDGETLVTILEQNEALPEGARFENVIEGEEINIYAYDCSGWQGKEVVETLSGRYGCYSKGENSGGAVYFWKWGE